MMMDKDGEGELILIGQTVSALNSRIQAGR